MSSQQLLIFPYFFLPRVKQNPPPDSILQVPLMQGLRDLSDGSQASLVKPACHHVAMAFCLILFMDNFLKSLVFFQNVFFHKKRRKKSTFLQISTRKSSIFTLQCNKHQLLKDHLVTKGGYPVKNSSITRKGCGRRWRSLLVVQKNMLISAKNQRGSLITYHTYIRL